MKRFFKSIVWILGIFLLSSWFFGDNSTNFPTLASGKTFLETKDYGFERKPLDLIKDENNPYKEYSNRVILKSPELEDQLLLLNKKYTYYLLNKTGITKFNEYDKELRLIADIFDKVAKYNHTEKYDANLNNFKPYKEEVSVVFLPDLTAILYGSQPVDSWTNKYDYSGDLVNNRPDGFGVLYQKSHDLEDKVVIKIIYAGYWKNGKPEGYGQTPTSEGIIARENGHITSFEGTLTDVKANLILAGKWNRSKDSYKERDNLIFPDANDIKPNDWTPEDNIKGIAIFWKSGKVLDQLYFDGVDISHNRRFMEKDVKLTGPLKIYHGNLLVLEGEFTQDGLFTGKGEYAFYSDDHEAQTEDAKWITLSEGIYKDSKLNGLGIEYALNGQIDKMGEYTDGIINGWVALYNEEGQLTAKGKAYGDKRDGDWEIYYENGNLARESTYENGFEVKMITYDLDGNKEYKVEYDPKTGKEKLTKY